MVRLKAEIGELQVDLQIANDKLAKNWQNKGPSVLAHGQPSRKLSKQGDYTTMKQYYETHDPEWMDPDYGAEEPLYKCDNCGGEIYKGDVYYIINEKIWCEKCAKSPEVMRTEDFQQWIADQGYDEEYLKSLEQYHWKNIAGVDDLI